MQNSLLHFLRCTAFVLCAFAVFQCFAAAGPDLLDLRHAVVVTRPGTVPNAERTAATVLIEEVRQRTGIALSQSTAWPDGKLIIAITSETNVPGWKHSVPCRAGGDRPETRPEGYRLFVENDNVVWVIGADARGTLFGVGQLLRRLDWAKGKLALPAALDLATAPVYPIRGHQLGYRATANSYDAWDVAQFEQYIRELTFFGVNSIEAIPQHDEKPAPLMKVSRREMNRALSQICDRYGLDYWAWVPADFALTNAAKRAAMLDRCEQFFRDCPTFTGFFFPGGDPGNNPPELVLAYLAEVWQRLQPVHPRARIWISLQGFRGEKAEAVYRYIEEQRPAWLGGIVVGPSSPPVSETRRRLPQNYQVRLYPDLTHNKLSQFEVHGWDQAYALTEGREAINPRPAEYARLHNRYAPFSSGFISYSDGAHDDVNKVIWSALAWNPGAQVRDVLVDYARVFFRPALAGDAADGMLALENNWHGPLVDNGGVEATLVLWRKLESAAPQLISHWRWQMLLVRADYDAYVRRRLIYETGLEREANAILADAGQRGSAGAIAEALAVLHRATNQPVAPDLRRRIEDLYAKLYQSIGLQSSVDKYHASGYERGASLDFVDLPLNNRWWLEDEFAKVCQLDSEASRCRRLQALAAWENPGPGSFYDAVGVSARSPHVVALGVDPGEELDGEAPNATYWWWDEGKSRARLPWQVTRWPQRMVYEPLDPQGQYVVRSSGYGGAVLRINGELVQPAQGGDRMGDLKEFPVPASCLKDGKLELNWDRPHSERHLGWREQPRLAEVWLIRTDHPGEKIGK